VDAAARGRSRSEFHLGEPVINSLRLLTLARDLRRRKARERTQCFVAEGVRAVEELLRSSLVVRGALVAPQLMATLRGEALRASLAGHGVDVLEVTDQDLGTAADTESPQGVLAIAEIPKRRLDAVSASGRMRILALDAVQDPGNVGTMVRSAAALGCTATVALSGTVDLWNAKVVRSAMGTHFTHMVATTTWAALDDWRSAHGVALWGADAHGEALPALASAVPSRLALVVGNEGAGLTPEARARVERLVAVPVNGVESLNVAVAAGILLYGLRG
jgi:TrmH family RNA methyltransferase